MWTSSTLRARLAELGLRPSRLKGQNFLVDPNFVRFLVREARVRPGDRILEIGPGPGVLTPCMVEAGARVLAVELDERLAGLCRETVGDAPHFELIVGDVLDRKAGLNPAVAERLAPGAAGAPPWRVVSNLPYSIATPAMLRLLERGLAGGECLVTVQREVADRWACGPGTKRYGAASVQFQAMAKVDVVRAVPPDVFWPAPRVQSAVVRLQPRPAAEFAPAYPRLCAWLRAGFGHRRKTFARCVAETEELGVNESEALRILASLGLPADARGETLSPEAYLRLASGK